MLFDKKRKQIYNFFFQLWNPLNALAPFFLETQECIFGGGGKEVGVG